ncbi:MAG: arginyltransferase [Rhodospirillales bacterium]
MKHRPVTGARFFFATAPMPCPYLPGRVERRLVTELAGPQVVAFHDQLSQAGFRRSHSIAYAPVCQDCSACAAVRIVADRFRPSRGQGRVWSRNRDLIVCETAPRATEEQFALFRSYQRSRHGDSDMARMDYYDYQTLVEDTAVDTRIFEFRDRTGALVAGCLTDRLADGFSAVYSFFDPSLSRRSLGTFVILWLVEHAKALGRRHVYLGYWVAGCSKMSYKARYQPLEAYTPEGWRPLRPDDPETARLFRAGP